MPRRIGIGGIVCALVVWLLGNGPCAADEPNPPLKVDAVSGGSSTTAMRKKAVSELPLDKIAADFRTQVDDLLKNVSLYHRLPTLRFVSEADVYQFFISHPDVAVSIWRVMDISNFELWQIGPTGYEADSNDGSTGAIEVLHSSSDRHLVLCHGSFKSPLLPKPIQAKALLHLQPTFKKNDDGQTLVTHTLDLFVSFPSQPVDITAKLISPVSHAMADRNFREVSLWCAMMNVAMCQQPGWVEQGANKMEGVLETRRGQLLKLAAQTFVTNRKRQLEQQTGSRDVSLEQVMAALRKSAQEGSADSKNGTIQVSAEQSTESAPIETAAGKK